MTDIQARTHILDQMWVSAEEECEFWKTEAKRAFERGYQGGLRFALAVCDEHNADVSHVRKRCTTAQKTQSQRYKK